MHQMQLKQVVVPGQIRKAYKYSLKMLYDLQHCGAWLRWPWDVQLNPMYIQHTLN